MRVAVLSGKGGTGKTFISVNLAAVGKQSIYIDCDIEEPNGHLFFKPKKIQDEEISVKIPVVDDNLCDGSRKCLEFCRFNALTYVKDKLIVFEDICHSCGGCIIACPQNALKEKDRVIGKVQKGVSKETKVYTGILNIGEPSGIPIISKMLDDTQLEEAKLTVIDCPPGSACSVMESIKDADYCILVAEPTLFGVHNLNMVYELVKLFKKPFGVIINKSMGEENPAEEFCVKNNIKILETIPFDNELGLINSNAKIAVREKKKYTELFSKLLKAVKEEVQK